MRILIILTVLVSIKTFGQRIDTLYLDSLSKDVTQKSKAKYVRIISGYDISDDRFIVKDYYLNGQKAFEGNLKFVNAGIPDGDYTYYFENGAIRLKGANKNILNYNKFEFQEELWHPNGKRQGNTSYSDGFRIHNLFDTLGRVEVQNGNGWCSFFSYIDKTINKGLVKNERKEGEWQVWDFNGVPLEKENYKNGKLIKRVKIKILDRPERVPPVAFGTGTNSMREHEIEKEISGQLKKQITKELNIEREIFYIVHVKDNKVKDAWVLRDKFITDNNINLSIQNVGQKVNFKSEEPSDDYYILSFKVKI